MRTVLAGVLLCLVVPVEPVAAATAIGTATRAEGRCQGVSEGRTEDLVQGTAIYLDEVVTTAVRSKLELTFDDGTTLTLGENARVKVDSFVYRPRGQGNEFKFSAAGPFRFISGALTKTPGSVAMVDTPVATIGIRGTDFWGGPIDGAFGVFLLDGAVTVTTGAGQVVLDSPGEGVNITDFRAAPGPVTIWPQDKVDRALSSVTFQ